MIQRALVTGANGFIGSALTRRLRRDGVAVRAMCRSADRGKSLAEAGAEVVQGNIQDAAITRRYAEGCDIVFHVAAVGAGSPAIQYATNVQGTRNVIRAAHEARARRFVHVSSIAVYGYEVDGQIDESHAQHPPRLDAYMRTKAWGEHAVWRYARRVGLPTVSVRPAFVYGPGAVLWTRELYEICRRYPVPLIGGGNGNAHPIYVEDVVDLLVTAATHPDAPGHAFHVAPDPAPTWREFLGYYARMADNRRTINIPLPPPVILRPVGYGLSQVARLFGTYNDIFGALHSMTLHATYCMDHAAKILGWQAQFSLEAGMALTQRWLKDSQ